MAAFPQSNPNSHTLETAASEYRGIHPFKEMRPMASQCSISDCGNKVIARGWCGKHYSRWRIHGDPLGGASFRPPSGEPLRYFREVVLAYDGDECLAWPYARGSHGYGLMMPSDGKKSRFVSRRVCEHVHGPAPTPKHELAHSCGKGHLACVTKRHLSWKTRTENLADMVIHGTIPQGERHGHAKLKEAQVLAIRRLRAVFGPNELAEMYGVSATTICGIAARRTWAWLQ